jgi:hypothetical protein
MQCVKWENVGESREDGIYVLTKTEGEVTVLRLSGVRGL